MKKSDVGERCDGAEVEFTIKKYNKGEWNECREIIVNGVVIDAVIKGEPVDWDFIYNEVEKMLIDG
jgi:hypothetical protein